MSFFFQNIHFSYFKNTELERCHIFLGIRYMLLANKRNKKKQRKLGM